MMYLRSIAAALAFVFATTAQAQSIEGRWRTEQSDPELCILISQKQFADPVSEISCQVKKRRKTGSVTWTVTLSCSPDGESWQDEALYVRQLPGGKIRIRLGSAGPLMVLQRC